MSKGEERLSLQVVEPSTRLTGPAAQAALDLAVSGSRPDLLAAMAASAGWRAEDLDPLILAGLVEIGDDRELRFADEAARQLALDAAPPATVRASHRRAAAACHTLHLPVRLIVEHLVRSTVLADDDVASQLDLAAEQAEAEDDLRTASEAWQAAAQLSTNPSDRVARAVRGLRLVIVGGLDYAGVDGLLDLLAGEQLSNECACWVEWLKALQRSDLDPDAAVTAQWSTIRRARDAAPGTLRALLWDAAMNAWTLGDAAGGLRAARDFAALESTSSDVNPGIEPPWAGSALLAAGLFEVGDVAEAASLRQEAIDAAATVDPTVIPFDTLLSIVFLDDLILDTGAPASNRIQVAIQRTTDQSATLACLLGIGAWRARARGDWSVADEMLSRGRTMAASTGATGAQLGMAALVVEMAAIRGDAAVLKGEGEWLREHASRKGDRRRLATLDRALGLSALVDGRVDEAVVRLGAAADATFLGRGLRDAVVPARVDIVEALVRRGDLHEARLRAEAIMPLLEAMDVPLAAALKRRTAALVSTGDDAIGCYRDALERYAEAADLFERARTLLLLGEAERRDRRRSDARVHLIEAVDAFASLGARPWLTRSRNELRAVGGRAEESLGQNPLTSQELSVARQAAAGLSTREVAEALFLSPRTVEFHLGNAYRKLGIHGRAALASRLASIGDPR